MTVAVGVVTALVAGCSGGTPAAVAPAAPTPFTAGVPDFLTSRQGWVLGSYPCGKATCEGLVTTTNAGRTWQSVNVPPEVRDSGTGVDSGVGVTGVVFTSTDDGLLFGTGAWVTRDAGRSWSHATTVAGVRSATVLSAAAGPAGSYLLLSGTDPTYGGSDNHERLAYVPAGQADSTVIDDLGTADAVGPVVSGDRVYVLRSGLASSAAENTVVSVSHTKITARAVPDAVCTEGLAASSATDLLLECGQGVAQGSMGARTLYGSTDGGVTWVRLPDPPAGGGYDGGAIADAGNGVAVIATGSLSEEQLIVTSDGGRSWHPALTFHGMQGYSFSGLAFQDATHGVVIGPPPGLESATTRPGTVVSGEPRQLYRTTDAGRTWAAVTIS